MQTQKQQTIDVNKHITDIIIAKLEQGIIPWKHPYTSSALPQNLSNGKVYRGVNTWLLSCLNYPENYFLSYKQLTDAGGKIKQGEKSHDIIFWKWTDVIDQQSEQIAKVPFLRLANVFNIEQCEGLSLEENPAPKLIADPFNFCEKVIAAMPKKPEIVSKGKIGKYNPFDDTVNLPTTKQFATLEQYFDMLLGLLINSTGHPKRLNRKEMLLMETFSGDPFSIEELIGDIGSSSLKLHCGIPFEKEAPNADTIEGWLKKLKGNKSLIVYACSLAQKAADYILNVSFEESNGEELSAIQQTAEATV